MDIQFILALSLYWAPRISAPVRCIFRRSFANTMSLLFSGSARRPFSRSQLSTIWYRTHAFSVATPVVADTLNIALLSMYSNRSLCIQLFAISRRDDVYNAERIGERGDPWGVPLRIGKGGETWSSTLIDTSLPVRKEVVHAHIMSGKPRF